MTLKGGERVYLAQQSSLKSNSSQLQQQQQQQHSSYPLGEPMSALLARVRRIRLQKELVAQRRPLDPTYNDTASLEDNDHRLWVDKHAPHSFAHLLSDERTNREVIRSLRAWDPYVFRRDTPPRPALHEDNNLTTSDRDCRPNESNRVILLSGPAGLGKTTLAHFCAKHTGYRPLEVNASDDRSAAVLKEHVLRAMDATLDFSKSTKQKPNCLILDEIDGADAKGGIVALVKLIRAEISKKTPYLRRPIIFICNNMYAPALRPLLPYCRHFKVQPPQPRRLVARLQAVLKVEHKTAGSALLHQLAACGDIRSCLYTLQFAASQVKLDNTDITKALGHALKGDGMKDERSDVIGMVNQIFRRGKDTIGSADRVLDAVQVSTTRATTTRTRCRDDPLTLFLQRFGDNNKLLDCLFLNILQVPYTDPTLDRCACVLEWISSSDTPSYAMAAVHIPAATGVAHVLCRVEQKQNLVYSLRELSDVRYQQEASQALVQKCVDRSWQATLIPYILWILSAGEGSSALQKAATSVELLSKDEKRAFDAHVATLVSLGLTYVVDEDTFDNSPTMRLEPPIDKLTQYMDLGSTRLEISQAVRDDACSRVFFIRRTSRFLFRR
jgi:chromosome transmission fidelity protein 18